MEKLVYLMGKKGFAKLRLPSLTMKSLNSKDIFGKPEGIQRWLSFPL